jgi:hypothetical protein
MRSIIVLFLAAMAGASAALINGGFDAPLVTGGTPHLDTWDNGRIKTYHQSHVPGWETTDAGIEVWSHGAYGFSAFNGYSQWAEINAYTSGTLSQTVSGVAAGVQFGFSFAHRGRTSATVPDVVRVYVTDLGQNNAEGGGDDSVLLSQDYSSTNVAWTFHAVNLGTRTNSNLLRLSFAAISTANGNKSTGNFIAGLSLDQGVGAGMPEPGSMAMMFIGVATVLVTSHRGSRKRWPRPADQSARR